VVNISNNVVNSITALYDPSGVNINGVGGWSVAVNSPSPNSVTITHPLGVPLTDFFSIGINGSNTILRTFIQLGITQYSVHQNSSFTTAIIYSITSANTGFTASGTGDFYILYFRAAQ
jgi:hypothetical protein